MHLPRGNGGVRFRANSTVMSVPGVSNPCGGVRFRTNSELTLGLEDTLEDWGPRGETDAKMRLAAPRRGGRFRSHSGLGGHSTEPSVKKNRDYYIWKKSYLLLPHTHTVSMIEERGQASNRSTMHMETGSQKVLRTGRRRKLFFFFKLRKSTEISWSTLPSSSADGLAAMQRNRAQRTGSRCKLGLEMVFQDRLCAQGWHSSVLYA